MARSFYWLNVFGSDRKFRNDMILAQAELNYRAQAADDQDLRVGIRTTRIGHSSFDFNYKIIQDETNLLVCEGKSVQVMFDYEAGQSVAISKSIRDSILTFEESGASNCEKDDE